jgi:hypothetical protein
VESARSIPSVPRISLLFYRCESIAGSDEKVSNKACLMKPICSSVASIVRQETS